jgi:tetratricopeptide (TPR) repeat protein
VCDVVLAEKRRTEGRACYAAVVELADATPAHLRRALTLALDDEDATTATTLLTRLVPAGSAPDGDDAALAARTRAMVDGDVAALDATTPWLATARAPQPLLEWRLKTQRAVGRLDDAVATLERLLPLSRGGAQRQRQEMQLVDLLVKQGAEARALAQLERTLSRSPRDAAVLAQKALVEVALDRIDDATATLARLRAVAPGDARIDTIAKRLQRSAPP